ncbi:hypothetical protein [Salinibacter sp.]|uniref:hypothetical protein n=1 Tax=Salinibacter sp. TaxID=2065818 RepID=UPI0021E7EAFD|nr:hypothetical protein [Salinibacter sp.]
MRDVLLPTALALLLSGALLLPAHAGPSGAPNPPAAHTIYVDADASGAGDGSSWTDAYTNLQDALEEARTNGQDDAVWVAAGTYYPDNGNSVTDGDRTASFVIESGIDLRGHFSGDESSLEDRNLSRGAPKTILSGEIQQDGDESNNAYTVLSVEGGMAGEVHVTGGTANGAGAEGKGGGAYVTGGMLHHAVLTDNRARYGAALYATGSPALEVIRATSNHATEAGALYFENDTATAEHLTVADNTAGQGANGLRLVESDATIEHFAFGTETTTGYSPTSPPTTYTVNGTLTDEDGDQLSNKDVLIQTTDDNTVATTTTNASGSYSVDITNEDLGGDTGEVESNPTGYNKVENTVTFQEGANTVDLSLPLTEYTRTFDVDDTNGNPVSNATIDGDETTNGDRDVFTASTNSNGEHTEIMTIDDMIVDGDQLAYTFNKEGYTGTTETETLADTTKTIKATLEESSVDRKTVSFTNNTLGSSHYPNNKNFDYQASTDDTTFTVSSNKTVDVPISDGDELVLTHSDSEYIDRFTANETPIFQGAFPSQPSYDSNTSITISKAQLNNELHVYGIRDELPEGEPTSDATQYFSKTPWTERDGYDEVQMTVMTTRVDNQEPVSQDVVDDLHTAINDVASVMPFPVTTQENTYNEYFGEGGIKETRGVNLGYIGVNSFEGNSYNTSNGYGEEAESFADPGNDLATRRSEAISSMTGIDDFFISFSDGNLNSNAPAVIEMIYGTQ